VSVHGCLQDFCFQCWLVFVLIKLMVIVNDFHSCYYKSELKYHEEDRDVCISKYHFRRSSPQPKNCPHFFNCSKAVEDLITVYSLLASSLDTARTCWKLFYIVTRSHRAEQAKHVVQCLFLSDICNFKNGFKQQLEIL